MLLLVDIAMNSQLSCCVMQAVGGVTMETLLLR